MPEAGHAVADCAIVGAGPIGLELAVALRHAGASIEHFEAGQIGATMQWWAPGTRFFSSPERIQIAGVPLALTHQEKASREEYLSYLRAVAQQFQLSIATYTRVISIERRSDHFRLCTIPSTHGVGGPQELHFKPDAAATVQAWHARNVILTIGDMHRPRMLNIPGESLPHVSHYLDDPHAYFGKRVLIVGGKNSAVEAALRLFRAGACVTLSYRGSEFDPKRVKYWLRPELEWLISKGKIAFHSLTTVSRIEQGKAFLQRAVDASAAQSDGGASDRQLANSDPSQVEEIRADFVLLLTGYEQDSSLFEMAGVELCGEDCVPKHDLHTMQTNVPGIYVAGTAAGGSQRRARLFIENSHVHVARILRHITGQELPWLSDVDSHTALEGG